jgi:uncharacterized coiled-coil protein SlyX|tara:strand:+ start:2108 stop:2416 length:309 start_codon:yes stop_codon:yes gene_type:complete
VIDHIEEIFQKEVDLDDTPWWTKYLDINIQNWSRDKLIKLYIHKSWSLKELLRELYDRIDELNVTIRVQNKLIKELDDKFKREQMAKKYYSDQLNKLKKELN